MIRTRVSLNPAVYAAAKRQAAAEGISVAAFIRQAICDKLPADDDQPWMQYAGMVATSDPNSSLSIDARVYGTKA
jgi:hypothetical protein